MSRPYRKERRAESEARTRLRITRALVRLHGTVGLSRTTVLGVAAEAGVQRATVYRHFPDEASMFAACSAHWMGEHPLPDPAAWKRVPDPRRRLRAALGDLYGYYERNGGMLGNVYRDAALVPAVRASLAGFDAWLKIALDAVAGPAGTRRGRGALARALVAHALAFSTWISLTRDCGLSRRAAVELMTIAAGAVSGRSGRP